MNRWAGIKPKSSIFDPAHNMQEDTGDLEFCVPYPDWVWYYVF